MSEQSPTKDVLSSDGAVANPPSGADDGAPAEQFKLKKRKCVDFHTPALLDVQSRLLRCGGGSALGNTFFTSSSSRCPGAASTSKYIRSMLLPLSSTSGAVLRSSSTPFVGNPSVVYNTYLAQVARERNNPVPITALAWSPGGRRLVTGNSGGMFTMWDGNTFEFSGVVVGHAHDGRPEKAFRAIAWARNGSYLVSSSCNGVVRLWSHALAPLNENSTAHDANSVNSLSFSPSDTKFCSAADDASLKVWDLGTFAVERPLVGHGCSSAHGWDVKCCEWHPTSSVIASGGKDNITKLWDPRQGAGSLATLHGHKNTVTKVAWNDNGRWLLTGSRDQTIKLYDLRTMRELSSLKGHNREVTSLAWHPLHETVFASGGMDGTLLYWNAGPTGTDDPAARVNFAHDNNMPIWDLAWHPAGHVLASGSNDRTTKFWARPRPGDSMNSEAFYDYDTVPWEGAEGSQKSTDPTGKAEMLEDEIQLGGHVGIVIGKKGTTIIGMQRSTGTKMHVDQGRRVLQIEGSKAQLELVKRRVGALLRRVELQDLLGGGQRAAAASEGVTAPVGQEGQQGGGSGGGRGDRGDGGGRGFGGRGGFGGGRGRGRGGGGGGGGGDYYGGGRGGS